MTWIQVEEEVFSENCLALQRLVMIFPRLIRDIMGGTTEMFLSCVTRLLSASREKSQPINNFSTRVGGLSFLA